MKHVFILAAGSRERWIYPYPKQLAKVGNETGLQRLIRQVQERQGKPYVVTHDIMLHNAAQEHGAEVIYPNLHRFTCETLLSTASLWQPPMLVIVGDGVFTRRAMSAMMDYDGSLRFFGNTAELMGIAFDGMHFQRMILGLSEVLRLHETPTGKERNPGKLWNLYRWMSDIPINQHVVKNIKQGGLLHHFDDCSFDFDTVTIYQDKCKIWERELDDYPEKAIS